MFFASKETYQIAKSNQIKYQIRFLKMTSHQIILIYINLMYRYVNISTPGTLTPKESCFSGAFSAFSTRALAAWWSEGGDIREAGALPEKASQSHANTWAQNRTRRHNPTVCECQH